MKQRFHTSGLVFLILLSICICSGCTDDKDSNPIGPDMSSWPDDLPKFEYGKLFQILNDEDTGEFEAASFSNITNPETAHNGYKTALTNSGWVFDEDLSSEYAWSCYYLKDPKSVLVTIQKDGSIAQIFYLAD